MAIGGTLVSVARVMFAVDTPQLKTDLSEAERVVNNSGTRMSNDVQRTSRTATRELEGIGRGALSASGLLQGLGRSVAFVSAGFLAGDGLVYAAKSAFDEMETGRKVTAQTNAVLASTAGVAGVTASGVDRLARSLMNKSSVNRNLIRSEEDVLLTFTNVRNVVGQGNDVFDHATRATLDLSVALKEDLKDASIQVGKALNDPVRGITALRRVGVQFSNDQVALIKHMVATNNVIGAQKLILQELDREFGGSAKALGDSFPGQLAKARQHLLELGAAIVNDFTPQLKEAGNWIDKEAQALQGNTKQHRELISAVHTAAGVVGDTISVVKSGFAVFQRFADLVGGDKEAIELLGTAALAWKLTGAANAVKGFSMIEGAAGVGKGGAARSVGLLLGRLRALAAIGIITVEIDVIKKALDAGAMKGTDSKGDLLPVWDVNSKKWVDRNNGDKPVNAASQKYWDSQYPNVKTRPTLMADGSVRNQKGGGASTNANVTGSATQKAIVEAAQTRGVGSGGIYGEQGGGAGARVNGTVYYDCSGYAQAVFQSAGFKDFPRTSEAQFAAKTGPNWVAKSIDPANAEPGDLVFYNYNNGYPLPASHVAIVVSGRGLSAKTIEYTSSGKPAVYGTVGEGPLAGAKRYNLTKQDAGTGSGADAPGNGGGGGGTTVKGVIPQALQLRLSEAQASGSKSAEISAERAILTNLEQQLSTTKNVKKKIELLNEITSTKASIKSLTAKAATVADLIPPSMQLKVDEAALRKNFTAELKALQAIDAYLTKKIAATKNIKKKIELVNQLQSTRDQETSVAAKIKQTNLTAIPGLAAVLGVFAQAQSGSLQTTAELPGVGKILISFAPTVADWQKIVGDLSKKLKAANERKAALQRSLMKAKRAKFKNGTLIARLNSAIKEISTTIAALQADIGDALIAIKDLNDTASSEAQQAAKEAETAAQQAADQAAQQAAQNFSDAMGAASSLPADIDLQLAQAEGTTSTGDDIAALERAASYYSNELNTGQVQTAAGTFALDTATKAAITRQLNQVNAQILQIDQSVQQTATDMGISFLTALRGLSQFRDTVLSPIGALGGSTIQVANYFQQGPDDPHLYAQGLQFELQALLG